MPKYKVLATILILGIVFTQSIRAQTPKPSNLERYAYQYIVELYERGESAKLSNEINAFQARYPQSYFRNHLRFVNANLILDELRYKDALRIYDDLLREDIEMSLRHKVYLFRAICLIGMGNNNDAMEQIQVLESETKDTFLLAQANLYRARLYKGLGQYYSAMQSYQFTLREHPEPEIEYEYLEVLVRLGREDDAQELLININPQSHIFNKSHVLWAKYLLDGNRFTEFELHMQSIPDIQSDPFIELLKIRKALANDDFNEAATILERSRNTGNHFSYYRALVKANKGETASADSIFAALVRGAEPEIKVLSYLERLKIMYQREPIAAMVQLAQFIDNPANDLLKAEQLYTMGFFAYMKQDYREALKFLAQARNDSNNRLLLADLDLLVAQCRLKLKDSNAALSAFNRYLNLYPGGKGRDTALYYLGFLYHEAKDYAMSASAFGQVISLHPSSHHVPSAKFYLAEIDFYKANYNQALDAFLEIVKAEPRNSEAILRVAQIYYYLGRLDDAEPWLKRLSPSYESLILEGHIHFVRKDFSKALESFRQAENSSKDPLRITEAKSYRALCLYQLKRFTEASKLYLELFAGKESPDTYLYLGAKSAYSAGDYHLALSLFDQFLSTYPDSRYFLPVLADVANSYFNMGNYVQATNDYMNILRRFRNVAEFTSADQAVLREVFTGLELSIARLSDPSFATELSSMIDSFVSRYVRFELTYLLTKLYAGKNQWTDVLKKAEQLRMQFPDDKRSEIELLMAESLINLNEYHQADSLLSNLYSDTLDLQALIAWAEVDVLLNNYEDAITKFRDALRLQPNADLWYKALKASAEAGNLYFDAIWDAGYNYAGEIPAAQIIRLEYLVNNRIYSEADQLAELIINESSSTHDHAVAFFYKAQILHEMSNYAEAIRELKKIVLLFPDYADVQDLTAYYIVLSYLKQGAREEAQMHLWDYAPRLSEPHLIDLNELFQEGER